MREYISRFELDSGSLVLDPFCGTGTTLVECKKQGVPSVGAEPNPMPYFASQVKTTWTVDPDGLLRHAGEVAGAVEVRLKSEGVTAEDDLPLFRSEGNGARLKSLPPEAMKLLLKDSISPAPLHKTLVLLEELEARADSRFIDPMKLALAKAVVYSISNLHFGPEVGVGTAKSDAPVVGPWMNAVRSMSDDLRGLRATAATPATVHRADSRDLAGVLPPGSVDAVITSPPYPNEKDYTRTTRLESVLLGFVTDKNDLRFIKSRLVRSNTRGVYKSDQDDALVAGHAEIQRIAAAIEKRRLELGKTSGFERMYARVTRLYFGGMARHLADLRRLLRPGARLAYVVGDQASYLRVMIRTGQLLADVARTLGYEVEGIDLFRTRLATATKEQLREEVVLLRWRG